MAGPNDSGDMRISVRKVAADAYSLRLGGTEVSLDGRQLKHLLLEAVRVLAPGAGGGRSAARDLAAGLTRATDAGIQALLRHAAEDDLLILLKLAEGDRGFLDKVYGNMSDRSRKMFEEDMSYRLGEDALPAERVADALDRLAGVVRDLEAQGLLEYEN